MDINKVLDFLKLSPKYLLPLIIVTGILLYLSDKLLKILGLLDFRNTYQLWIGIVFITSLAIILSNIAFEIISICREKISTYISVKKRQKLLHELTPPEKDILKRYLTQNTKSQYLFLENGVVRGLEADKILYRSSNTGSLLIGIAYNIHLWAWKYLKQNPHLLEE